MPHKAFHRLGNINYRLESQRLLQRVLGALQRVSLLLATSAVVAYCLHPSASVEGVRQSMGNAGEAERRRRIR